MPAAGRRCSPASASAAAGLGLALRWRVLVDRRGVDRLLASVEDEDDHDDDPEHDPEQNPDHALDAHGVRALLIPPPAGEAGGAP